MKKRVSFLAVICLAMFTSYVFAEDSNPEQEESQLNILFIGDSVTDGGWGRSGGSMAPSSKRNHSDLNHVYGHSYMMLCTARLMADYHLQNWKWFNRGISGNTLDDLEVRWQEDVLDLHPSLLSVLIGTNDVAKFVTANIDLDDFDIERWIGKYRGLLNKAKAQNPDLKIILISPFICKGRAIKEENFSRQQTIIDECSSAVKSLASEIGAVYVDANSMFHSLTDNNPDRSKWIWDGIHPTAAGHQRLADLWIQKVKETGLL